MSTLLEVLAPYKERMSRIAESWIETAGQTISKVTRSTPYDHRRFPVKEVAGPNKWGDIAETTSRDAALLQGVWEYTELQICGKKVPQFGEAHLLVSNGRFGLVNQSGVYRGRVEVVGEGRRLKAIFHYEWFDKPTNIHGALLELAGQKLKICFNTRGIDIPREFDAPKSGDFVLQALRQRVNGPISIEDHIETLSLLAW